MAHTIVGDIGGTNSRLALYENGVLRAIRVYPSSEFNEFLPLLKRYLADIGLRASEVATISIGVAGTVEHGRVEGVNLPWSLDASTLAEELGARIHLLNDFEAAAWGVTALGEQDLFALGPVPPRRKEAQMCILGAGTGLGEAIIVPCQGHGLHVVSTEGGHADYAPTDQEEWGLFCFLKERFGHVSVERVVSGPGLQHLYEFFGKESLAPEVVVQRALERRDHGALTCLRIFVKAFAREAANLALKSLSFGGVYIAGGIAPKIKETFLELDFRRHFEDKGRMKKILQEIPVFICLHPYLGLLGAGIRSDHGPT